MVSVEEATKIIHENLWKGRQESVPLMNAINRVLAENVLADRNFPPFDRVTMDGVAIAYKSYETGQKQFPIAFVQAAGEAQQRLNDLTACGEVMTGAILPDGADTVIRYEDIEIEHGTAIVKPAMIRKGDHIHVQGNDAKKGVTLLREGQVLSAAEIPVLASVGKSQVLVKALPKVALISTGDELVDLDVTPKPHQIRKSNMYALASALSKYKIEAEFFHLKDNETSIRETLVQVLGKFDLIILSGGVSKGKFDLVPRMLEEQGIQKKFHQISQRPGKPMLFGMGDNKTVFALPGNPVSTFLCYYRYVDPWLITSLGGHHKFPEAILGQDFTLEVPLTYFLQVKIISESGQSIATPIPGGGSGDFVNLKDVDGFLELPMGGKQFKKSEIFSYIPFRT